MLRSLVCLPVRALLVLSVGVALLAPRAVQADAFKGKVMISDAEFGTGYGSDAEMAKAVKKQSKATLKGDGPNWTLNLMVFLNAAPGAKTINIVYYDVSVKPADQVNFSEVAVQPTQKIVQVNGVSISKDLGFVKGHKYEVRATRVIGGKEKVFAKGTVTLK
ncbi:MAG TPA: hypothetical protein VHU40_15635 [Polyangia bacterium]|nr:hypothetical protein [Polyangia bacterium]